MDDPTQSLIRSLDDPTQWVTIRRVAVFRSHDRGDGDTALYRVKDSDLAKIAENTNRAIREAGHLPRLTLGHTLQEANAREVDQPQLLGFCTDFSVETVDRPGGSFKAVVCTEKVRREWAETLKSYPYRSVEYDWKNKQIAGSAALVRSPYLELGAVVPYRGTRKTVTHYLGVPAVTEDKKFTDDEEKMYGRFMEYMKSKSKKFAKYFADNDDDDDDDKKKDKESHNANPQALAQYAAQSAEIAALKQQMQYQQIQAMLAPFGGLPNFNAELHGKVLAGLPQAERLPYLQEVANYAAPASTGHAGFIPMAAAVTPQPKADKMAAPLTEAEFQKAVAYQAKSKATWEDSYAHVKSQRS
jgi:hypothetical protein